ncbi:hypothetical protein PLICRDRAFT_112094 [Plicaturopsis crispa FD-325 SS-3]|nr:hypothetical protein PLICRDRAFT_112094 [Plicaturopsis crispa FD-325 SS-3]
MSNRPISSLSLPKSTLSALTRAGYETTSDISATSAEMLAKDLNIPVSATQAIISASQKTKPPSMTQSAASLVVTSNKFATRCRPVDALLSGGLTRGNILEISGPPGTPKEAIALNLVKSFVEADEEVLFIDTQNMSSPASICKIFNGTPFSDRCKRLVHHANVHSLPDLMIFMHKLPAYLSAHPRTGLLVVNSISFPFQSSQTLTPGARNSLLARIKQTFTKACASHVLSIVVTSQLATKLLNADGTPGNFDTGSRAVMVPQLGPSYLPSGRTHRLVIFPQRQTAGVVRVISSPNSQPGDKGPPQQENYEMVRSQGTQCITRKPI